MFIDKIDREGIAFYLANKFVVSFGEEGVDDTMCEFMFMPIYRDKESSRNDRIWKVQNKVTRIRPNRAQRILPRARSAPLRGWICNKG